MDKEKDKKSSRPASAAPATENTGADPRKAALGEIYQKLYPEMRRPKPSQEAIAAALQAMQRLTVETDSEAVVEEATLGITESVQHACRVCGHQNRVGNKFCGMCGLPLSDDPGEVGEFAPPAAVHAEIPMPAPIAPEAHVPNVVEDFTPPPEAAAAEFHPAAGAPAGAHHYHHHYHHHFFQNGQSDLSATIPGAGVQRSNAPESAREADRLRIAAAAKGEPMSRSEAAVRRLTQEWILACNTRQLDELIELYATDALVLRSNLPPIRGAGAVREYFYASLEAGLGEVALDPMRVEILGELAHEVGRYSALVPGTVGKRREERGKYLWVFAKQANGEWKLISECWCADLTLGDAESDFAKPSTPAAKAQARKS